MPAGDYDTIDCSWEEESGGGFYPQRERRNSNRHTVMKAAGILALTTLVLVGVTAYSTPTGRGSMPEIDQDQRRFVDSAQAQAALVEDPAVELAKLDARMRLTEKALATTRSEPKKAGSVSDQLFGVWGRDALLQCNASHPESDITVYAQDWKTSMWKYVFIFLTFVAGLLMYGQLQEIRGDVEVGVKQESPGALQRVVDSIRCADTFKQLCAYDPFKDPGQAPEGNAYRLLAIVGPSVFGIEHNNKDGQNDSGEDRTDGGFKATLPNILGYLNMIVMSICILVMQVYFPYLLISGANAGAVFIGFKKMAYYQEFPSRLGLELVPLTLMSTKFFVTVEKVVREEFNQCLWLYHAIEDGNIKFQCLGKVWSYVWVTISLLVNTYIATVMTCYVVIAICTYGGNDIMSFFLKVLGSLGLISFDDDIMGALPQWAGWYQEHCNAAGHPQGGHPAGAYSDFFAGPESIRGVSHDVAPWGERVLLNITVEHKSDWNDFKKDLKFEPGTNKLAQLFVANNGDRIVKGMRLVAIDGKRVWNEQDMEAAHKVLECDVTQEITIDKSRWSAAENKKSMGDYASALGVEWDGKALAQQPTEDSIAGKHGLHRGAELVRMHGHDVDSAEHMHAIAERYSKLDVSKETISFTFRNRRHHLKAMKLEFSALEKFLRDSAGIEEEALKKYTPAKEMKTKFVRLGFQIDEKHEELGFRLCGTMISTVAADGAAAFAVDMGEVDNGLTIGGVNLFDKWTGSGQPDGDVRIRFLYKQNLFDYTPLINGKGLGVDKPKCTGLQPGMFVSKVNGRRVNSFGDIMRVLRDLKGDDLNYSTMRFDQAKEKKVEGCKEWTGMGLSVVTRKKEGEHGEAEVTKEFTMTLSRAGDEDSSFDDLVHGFIYMWVRIVLSFSLLFILVSYWVKDCIHVGV
eukprot:TRINITY_DN23073_c0_g1_i1.p1 TRINITY_DN23073_c0_g1~~TRINITY_DN23073_c0_g1_i1.p1  ORF type:complete len:913 (+),score=401.46 TRINITY_DN23073_c0_g1_i1:105-2843(+)